MFNHKQCIIHAPDTSPIDYLKNQHFIDISIETTVILSSETDSIRFELQKRIQEELDKLPMDLNIATPVGLALSIIKMFHELYGNRYITVTVNDEFNQKLRLAYVPDTNDDE